MHLCDDMPTVLLQEDVRLSPMEVVMAMLTTLKRKKSANGAVEAPPPLDEQIKVVTYVAYRLKLVHVEHMFNDTPTILQHCAVRCSTTEVVRVMPTILKELKSVDSIVRLPIDRVSFSLSVWVFMQPFAICLNGKSFFTPLAENGHVSSEK